MPTLSKRHSLPPLEEEQGAECRQSRDETNATLLAYVINISTERATTKEAARLLMEAERRISTS
jgi:hypothetical protein